MHIQEPEPLQARLGAACQVTTSYTGHASESPLFSNGGFQMRGPQAVLNN